MSCFGTGGDEALKEQTRRNKVIDQQLKKDKDVYGNTHRLLLLGELYKYRKMFGSEYYMRLYIGCGCGLPRGDTRGM